MKTICVIVTYNPDTDFDKRLNRMKDEFDEVIVVDNFSTLKPVVSDSNIKVIYNSSNLGVATALNQGITLAVTLGAEYVCLFDQDSVIKKDFTKILINGFRASVNVGIVAANYVNPTSGKLGYSNISDQKSESYFAISHSITSGSMISARILPVCGLMRDDYFIDYVDIEFCERVRKNGFIILSTNNFLMEHPIGEVTNHNLLWYKLSASNHSPLRRYYMARNCIFSARENLTSNFKFSVISFNRLIRVCVVTLLFEKNKLLKTKAIMWGVIDGFVGRMGHAVREI